MRPFLADVLDGKRKRPRKKISKGRTEFRNVMLLSYVVQARQRGEKDWLAKAEDKFRLTARHIQKILENERGGSNEKLVLAEPEKFEEQISSFLGTEFKDSPLPGGWSWCRLPPKRLSLLASMKARAAR